MVDDHDCIWIRDITVNLVLHPYMLLARRFHTIKLAFPCVVIGHLQSHNHRSNSFTILSLVWIFCMLPDRIRR